MSDALRMIGNERSVKRMTDINTMLYAVELLEYHDKNLLASGESISRQKQQLLKEQKTLIAGLGIK